MLSAPASAWVAIRWPALWQLWAGVAVYLCWWQMAERQPATWAETGYLLLVLTIGSLLLTLLALLLKPEPLAIYLDYRAGRVTCYRPGLPWRIRLPLSQVSCQLGEQASHKGSTHFLVVSGAQGQAWVIQESSGWPLGRLQQLQESLTFDVP